MPFIGLPMSTNESKRPEGRARGAAAPAAMGTPEGRRRVVHGIILVMVFGPTFRVFCLLLVAAVFDLVRPADGKKHCGPDRDAHQIFFSKKKTKTERVTEKASSFFIAFTDARCFAIVLIHFLIFAHTK